MSKEVFLGNDAISKIQKGFNTLADVVGGTLGAGGKGVFIASGYGHYPIITKDGVTVAKSTSVKDEIENAGVMVIRGAAEKTLETCGDGTTTSVVLAQSILNNGIEVMQKGCNVQEVKSGIEKSVECVVNHLKSMAVEVKTGDMIKNVATVSANNDPEIGKLIGEAYDKIGLNGLLTIEDSKTIDTYVSIIEGAEMPRGWAGKEFCTDMAKMLAVYENPMIFVLDYEIKSVKEMTPLLNEINETLKTPSMPGILARPLIIIARGFQGEIFNSMLVNKLKNGVPVCLICAPTAYQKEALQDMCVLTGAKLICDEKGVKPEHATMDDMGTCKKIIVSKNSTLILEGNTNQNDLEQTKQEIAIQIKDTTNTQLIEILNKRLARLTGSIGILYVGGATDVEIREKKDRVDDAVRAVKSSIEEGVVVGGGIALIRCIEKLKELKVNGDELIGGELILKALYAPISKMMENAGIKMTLGDLDNENPNYGYNIKTKSFGDLFEQGIIDPVKVVRCALQNAASIASQVITSGGLLVEMRPD